jgi:hypothetical protein
MKRALALGMLALALTGCGGDDDDGAAASINSGPVTGKVAGASWTLTTAQTDTFLSEGDEFWVDLYAEALTSCNDFGSGNSIILSVPKRVGTHRMSLSLNGTFVIANPATGGDNLVATDGAIRVDEITDVMLRGGVTMTYDADNSINGEFEAVICP